MSESRKTADGRRKERLELLLGRERELWAQGLTRVAGVDEAGLGPLAGPVTAAAVIFPPGCGLEGVDDSKRLTPRRRAGLVEEIKRSALTWSVAEVDPLEIDQINVYQAGMLAMRRALKGLAADPELVLVDGRGIQGLELPQEPWIKGDARCHVIAAASILAKTARDAKMHEFDEAYPGYGFAAHKGYATAAHRDAIRRLGPSPIHRHSFTLLPPKTFWD